MRLARSLGSLNKANMNGSATYTPKQNRKVLSRSVPHLADNNEAKYKEDAKMTDSLTASEFPTDHNNVSMA